MTSKILIEPLTTAPMAEKLCVIGSAGMVDDVVMRAGAVWDETHERCRNRGLCLGVLHRLCGTAIAVEHKPLYQHGEGYSGDNFPSLMPSLKPSKAVVQAKSIPAELRFTGGSHQGGVHLME